MFLAVARAGTALGAAQQLQVNHSTVIRRIDHLEAQLGARLFKRLQSGYQLTTDGHNVLSSAEQMEEGALKLQRLIKGKESVSAGTLKLSQPENSLLDLSRLLCAFCKEYPQIQLQIVNTADVSNLNRLEADVAVRLTDTPPELLLGREVGRINFAVYAHRDYLGKFTRTPKAEQCDWLLWRGTSSSRVPEAHHPDQLLMARVPGANVLMRSNSMEDILAGIKAGMGAGLISELHGEAHEQLIRLPYKKILEDTGFASVGLWLLSHRDMRQSARVKAFFNFAAENFGTYL